MIQIFLEAHLQFHIYILSVANLTLTPSVFDNGSNLIQNEYRKVGKN